MNRNSHYTKIIILAENDNNIFIRPCVTRIALHTHGTYNILHDLRDVSVLSHLLTG
jgi:hypothetical protein